MATVHTSLSKPSEKPIIDLRFLLTSFEKNAIYQEWVANKGERKQATVTSLRKERWERIWMRQNSDWANLTLFGKTISSVVSPTLASMSSAIRDSEREYIPMCKVSMLERLLKIWLLTGGGGVLNLSPRDTVYGFWWMLIHNLWDTMSWCTNWDGY